MPQGSMHDWLRPRVERLLREAAEAGFERDVAVAVLLDLAGSAPFDTAPLPPEPEPPHGPWPKPPPEISPDMDVGEIGLQPEPNLLGDLSGRRIF